ncbi:unnamed protein product [Arctogadus glacialis]
MTITRDTHDGDSAGLTWDAVPPAAMDGLGSDGGEDRTPNPQISIHSQVAEREGRTYRWTDQGTFPRHTLDC